MVKQRTRLVGVGAVTHRPQPAGPRRVARERAVPHTHNARAAGETEQRLNAVAVWNEAPFFTERERAALAFAESVTRLATTHVPDADYAAVAAALGPEEIGALLALIVAINAWNALSVASRSWTPAVRGPVA